MANTGKVAAQMRSFPDFRLSMSFYPPSYALCLGGNCSTHYAVFTVFALSIFCLSAKAVM